MSLHAQLSPEAQQQLAARQRNSTLLSIVISLLVIVLLGLILAFIFLPSLIKETPVIVSYSSSVAQDENLEAKKVTNQVERKPSAPSSSMAKVIAANTSSPTAVPVPDIAVTDPSLDFGNGDDFGDGWGSGGDGGGGGGFGNIPATMQKRCSRADRMERLLENGGTEECEEAVMSALRWLKSTQNNDGSWSSPQVAMTGFALLAYLGHCETPLSEEFGESVTSAIIYLVDIGMKNNGRLAVTAKASNQWVYEHGIATYALAEAYTFCSQLGVNIPNLGEVTRKAGDMIMEGQTDAGGWLYRFANGGGGDNSVGFWQIQALKACKHTGLWDKGAFKKVSKKALEWLTKSQSPSGAIGYRGPGGATHGLTGGGVLCFQMWGEGKSKPVRSGIKNVAKHSEFNWKNKSSNLYYHYYNAQAMINYGGNEWKKYNDRFRDALLKEQNDDGSWNRAKKIPHGSINTHMTTCLATFMLEVYYRFLPATGEGVR